MAHRLLYYETGTDEGIQDRLVDASRLRCPLHVNQPRNVEWISSSGIASHAWMMCPSAAPSLIYRTNIFVEEHLPARKRNQWRAEIN
jgi:hypothetical protein